MLIESLGGRQMTEASARAREGARAAGIVVAGVLALTLLVFVTSLADQLGRLHAPNLAGFGYKALHGKNVAHAFEAWRHGVDGLREFTPTSPEILIRAHVAADAAFALALGVFVLGIIHRLKAWSWLRAVVIAGLIASLVEGLLELSLVFPDPSDRYVSAFRWIGVLKIGCLAVVALALLWHGVWPTAGEGGTEPRRPRIWRALQQHARVPATPRLVFALALGFAVLLHAGDIGKQAEDLLRRELDQSGGLALLRIGATLAVYLFVLLTLKGISLEEAPASPTPGNGGNSSGTSIAWRLAQFGIGAVLLGSLTSRLGGGAAPLVLGAILLLLALASRGGARSPSARERGASWLFVIAAVAPPLSLAALSSRLLAGEAATQGRWPRLAWFTLALLAAAVIVGWRVASDPAEENERPAPWRRAALVVLAAMPLVVAVIELFTDGLSERLGNWLGSLGVLVLVLASVAAAAGVVRLLLADVDRPGFVERFGLRRTPIIAVLVFWVLLSAWPGAYFTRPEASPHRVRLVARHAGSAPPCPANLENALGPAADAAPQIARALCAWLEGNAKVDPASKHDSTVPLLLASASGGGVRAAAWTARVLDCLLMPPPGGATDPCGTARVISSGEPRRLSLLFAGSGASGGSVGIASAVAQDIAPMTDDAVDWVRQLADVDHVGPVVAHMGFAELPLTPFGIVQQHDRAEVLMDGWAGRFGTVTRCDDALNARKIPLRKLGFLEARAHCPGHVPLTFLNSTIVHTGRRLNVSPVRTGVTNLLDVLCANKDVPLIDAAFLSARFPFVTPSGRFLSTGDGGCGPGADLVDGGYLENSGTQPIADLWPSLAPLLESYNKPLPDGYRPVQAIWLRIENGEIKRQCPTLPAGEPPRADEQSTAGSSRLGELLRVPEAGIKVHSHGGAISKDSARRLEAVMARSHVPVLHFALYTHPGRRLPLGWALTDGIIDDIDHVFQLGPNADLARELRGVLRGGDPATIGCKSPIEASP